MTRTITTADLLDALPVKAVLLDEGGWPVWRDPHAGWCAANGTRGIPADLLLADGAPLTILHDPSAPAPAPSVVPEAAVEAAASAVRKERAFSAAAAFGVPMDDVPQCAETIVRAALTAALPFLTAAPSATIVDTLLNALNAYRDEAKRASQSGSLGAPIAILAGSALAKAVEVAIATKEPSND